MPRILVVDDEPIILMVLEDQLSEMGHDVVGSANTSETAIQKARELLPDLVLMDIALSTKSDGIDTARQIRNELQIPIIFITGHKEDSIIEMAKECEPAAYIIKPIDPGQLKASIEIALYRKEIEKRLRESENRFRLIAEHGSDVIWTADLNLTLTYLSPSVKTLLEYTPDEFMKQKLSRIFSPQSFQTVMKLYTRELKSGMRFQNADDIGYSLELELIRKSGSKIWTEFRIGVLRDEENRPETIFGITRDITARKKAEAEIQKAKGELENKVKKRTAQLERSNQDLQNVLTEYQRIEKERRAGEQKYRSLLETMNDGFVLGDENEIITYTNKAYMKMVGFPEDEILGRPFALFAYGDNKELVAKQRELRKKGIKDPYELTLATKDGRKIFCIVSPQSIFSEKGDYMGSFATITDISNLKEAEQELTIKSAHLQELNTALKILLERRDEDRHTMEERILYNVKTRIMPHLEKVKQANLSNRLSAYLQVVESQLMDLVSPFARELSTKFLDLTPTEIQIANYVKEGRSSKEIAELLGVAKCTVDTHRNQIRKKLKISGRAENLRSYLLSFDK